MTIVAALLFVPVLFYTVLIGAGAVGFIRTGRADRRRSDCPSVSVIIPARNEEAAVGACLKAVLENDYPQDRLEIVVVDDGSVDGTADVVRQLQRSSTLVGARDGRGESESQIRLVCIRDDPARRLAHKKAALQRGVEEASGDIVITTDADCVVTSTWIRTMVDAFDPTTGMVIGPVLYRRDGSLFGDLQALEFLALVALGGGLAAIGRPHLCNSANLAYRRIVYDEIGGYEGLQDVSTGDDEMLMHRVAFETAWEVEACMHPSAVVETDANESISEFFHQRRRWASAHARYPHAHLTIASVLCYMYYFELAAGAVAAAWVPGIAWIVATAFGLKLAVESAVVVPATVRFGRTPLLRLFLPAELVQIAYVLVIGIVGTFGGYEWKGRRVPR